MPKLLCVFLLSVTFSLFTSTRAWDLAITVNDQIEFLNSNNGSRQGAAAHTFRDLTALTLDPISQTLFFSDLEYENATIMSLEMRGRREITHVFRKGDERMVNSMTFDPLQRVLYWTEMGSKSIMRASFADSGDEDLVPNVFLKLEHYPSGIVVDSCRGVLYWTQNTQYFNNDGSIESATVTGENRTVIATNIYKPSGITISYPRRRLFWVSKMPSGYGEMIQSSMFDGSDIKIHYQAKYSDPAEIAVDNTSIYWTDIHNYKLQKILIDDNATEPETLRSYSSGKSIKSIVFRHDLLEEIRGIDECKVLEEFVLNNSRSHVRSVFDSGIITTLQESWGIERESYCLNNGTLKDQSGPGLECVCPRAFTGKRCESHICRNYCVSGTCVIEETGSPVCRCNKGFSGVRCELSICSNYCLNKGFCSVKESTASCSCQPGYEGSRCETETSQQVQENNEENATGPAPCSFPVPNSVKDSSGGERASNDYVDGFDDSKGSRGDSFESAQLKDSNSLFGMVPNQTLEIVICTLMALCFMLTSTVCFLGFKVATLKKRPRNPKRIIVKKNATPLTTRPDSPQCEIMIENCCNMNVCETPCYEPSSLLSQNVGGGGKSKKEEKRNLLLDMEHPDY